MTHFLSQVDPNIFFSVLPYDAGVFPIHLSDHYPTFVCINNILVKNNELIKTKFRCHNIENIRVFQERVTEIADNFENNFNNFDINDRCKRFCDLLYNSYNSSCPIKCKTISQKRAHSPWLSDELLRCIARKHELYRLAKGDGQFNDLFKRYKNLLTLSIRNAKKQYYKDKFNNCTGDVKKTWNTINSILRPNVSRQCTYNMNVEGVPVSDPVLVATEFNEHYATVADKLADNIPRTGDDPTYFVENCCNSFVLMNSDHQELESVINQFKSKRSHLNVIPSFMYKYISKIISPILSTLINDSFCEGQFPDVLKTARVIPIFKSGQREIISNYRPISTLHFLCKVYERIMFKRLCKFFKKYDIINDEQFGFRKNRSTSDAVLKLTDNIYETFNTGQYMVSVLLDFSKAFDTVNHNILLQKLYMQGVRGNSLQWIRSYLSNRQQYVSINESTSSVLPINIGVPQGSILGPLLFILYINDMCRCSNILSFIHFADDTTVFIRGDNLDSLYDTMNNELKKIDSWLCSNKLSLNISKTSFMVHSNKSKTTDKSLLIRNTNISLVHTAKFLGILIDDELKFKDHIRFVCGKVSKSVGIIRRLSGIVPSYVLKKIYMSLIYPYLIYCVETWGNSSKTMLSKLCGVQNKCIKLISDVHFVCVSDLYDALNLFPFAIIFKYFTTMKFYNYFLLNSNPYFKTKIDSFQTYYEFDTRFKIQGLLRGPHVNRSIRFNSFLFQAVKLWNILPQKLKCIDSPYLFKRSLRQFYS